MKGKAVQRQDGWQEETLLRINTSHFSISKFKMGGLLYDSTGKKERGSCPKEKLHRVLYQGQPCLHHSKLRVGIAAINSRAKK
jgi:hypothetical protein